VNCDIADRAGQLQLIAELRESLADSERELLNRALFTITQRCIRERIARLRDDIAALCRELGEPVTGRTVTL
jgi:hypothetical protein